MPERDRGRDEPRAPPAAAASVRHARDAHTTASSARNAGTDSSITWLVYLMVQVWTARNSPPSGDTTASSTADATPNTAFASRATVSCGSGRSFACGAVVGRSGISGAGGSGAIARPVTTFASDGCSVR